MSDNLDNVGIKGVGIEGFDVGVGDDVGVVDDVGEVFGVFDGISK